MGKVQVLETPSGKVLKSLVEAGVKLGISSRGLGSTEERGDKTYVKSDFQLICFDFVSEPSTPGAYMMTEGNKKKLNSILYNVDTDLGNTKTHVKTFALEKKNLNSKISQYEKDNVSDNYAKLEKLEEERDLFQIEIDKLKIEVRTKLDKIEKLGNLTYDEDCDDCMSNPFTLDAIETQKYLDKDKILAQQYVTKKQRMETRIQKMFKVRAYKNDLDSLVEELSGLNIQESHTTSQFSLLEEKRNILTGVSWQKKVNIMKVHWKD